MNNKKLSTTHMALLYGCYFLLGFALLSLEVIWGRLTALTLGSSIQAYSITLAAVMAGLFFGAFHGSRVSAHADIRRLFAYMIGFTLLAGVASISFVYLSEFFKSDPGPGFAAGFFAGTFCRRSIPHSHPDTGARC
jgi:predicted membrane-bound spermidine synthase